MKTLEARDSFELIDVSIERIWLDIRINANSSKRPNIVYFIPKDKNSQIIKNDNIRIVENTKNEFTIRQNIACLNKKDFLFGKYILCLEYNDNNNSLYISENAFTKVNNLCKVYELTKGRNLYTINFSINFEENLPRIEINANYSKTINPNQQKAKGNLLKFLRFLFLKLLNITYQFFSYFNKKNIILFYSDTSDEISQSMKLLSNVIKEKNDKEKIVFIANKLSNKISNNLLKTLHSIIQISRTKVLIIDNFSYLLNQINTSKQTKIIQLWHANEGFKSVGYSRFGLKGSPKINSFYKRIDCVITANENTIEMYEEVFGIPKKHFFPLGRINSQQYFDKKYINECINNFEISFPNLKNKEIILFAPTYRGSSQKEAHYPNDFIDLKRLNETLSNDQILLIKMHPFIEKSFENQSIKNFDKLLILDSNHPIDKVLPCVNILITDYSSIYSDFSYFKRPIIFYTPDRLEYQYSRGVCHDILSFAPGKVCDTFEDLIKSLKTKDFNIEKTIKYSNSKYSAKPKNTLIKISDLVLGYNN